MLKRLVGFAIASQKYIKHKYNTFQPLEIRRFIVKKMYVGNKICPLNVPMLPWTRINELA